MPRQRRRPASPKAAGTDEDPSNPRGESVPLLYALHQRERCKPAECTAEIKCWVAIGGWATLSRDNNRTPRCLACNGVVQFKRWQTPSDWAKENELTLPKIID